MGTNQRSFIIGSQLYDVDDDSLLGDGAEGEVYEYHGNTVIKAFNQQSLAAKRARVEYLLSLGLSHPNIMFPQQLVYEHNTFVGYTMPKLSSVCKLNDLIKSVNQLNINNFHTLSVCKRIFEDISMIHNQGILLGDFNPQNFYYNNTSLEVYYIDTDAWGIGNFKPNSRWVEYPDPINQSPSKTTDLFGYSCLVFQLVTGYAPWKHDLNSIQKRQSYLNVANNHPKRKDILKRLNNDISTEFVSTLQMIIEQDNRSDAMFARLYNCICKALDKQVKTINVVNANVTISSNPQQLIKPKVQPNIAKLQPMIGVNPVSTSMLMNNINSKSPNSMKNTKKFSVNLRCIIWVIFAFCIGLYYNVYPYIEAEGTNIVSTMDAIHAGISLLLVIVSIPWSLFISIILSLLGLGQIAFPACLALQVYFITKN
jgi:serine/threonine protein kinase